MVREGSPVEVNGLNLSKFQGDLLWLVGCYVRAGDLPNQEAVDKLRVIIEETIAVDPTGDNEARTYFGQKCLEVFHLPFDLYNDPEDRFGRRDVFAAGLLQGLVDDGEVKQIQSPGP